MSLKLLAFIIVIFYPLCYCRAQTDTVIKKIISENISPFKNLKQPLSLNDSQYFKNKFFTGKNPLPGKLNFKSSKILSTELPKVTKLTIDGGYIGYQYNYRSLIDTPLRATNISQHFITGNLGLSIYGVPIKVNYLIRRSNSPFFADINNFQIEYDGGMYKNKLKYLLREQLKNYTSLLKDSLLELDYKLKIAEFKKLENDLNDPGKFQKYFESKEIVNIPEQTTANTDTATANALIKLKNEAKGFIDEYEALQKSLKKYEAKKDSVEMAYKQMLERIESYKNFIQEKASTISNTKDLKNALLDYGITNVKIPERYQFLMNIRRIAIGRNQVNYSALTCKNISVTGVNFEYNSWYYLALTAGTVDFRFRDFVVTKFNQKPQYMYMARIGIGKIEKSFLILSAFKGQKQLFVSNIGNGNMQSIPVKGISVEGKLRINSGNYIMAEVAQSVSPDYSKNPSSDLHFGLKHHNNMAYMIQSYSWLKATRTRIDAMYRYTGANFQSFNSFQTNSTMKSWNVKLSQQVFKNKLSIMASLRKNDFYNDVLTRRYESNTVFKSLQLTFRAKGLPYLTVGYLPIAQLTYVDNILIESQFQSLNAGLTHKYKLLGKNANFSIVYNKFYGGNVDLSNIYYNAENIYFAHFFAIENCIWKFAISKTRSNSFELLVLESGLEFVFGKNYKIGFGAKGNDFNRVAVQTGLYANVEININKIGTFRGFYEKGYLPGNDNNFMKNNMMNVSFIKQLKPIKVF